MKKTIIYSIFFCAFIALLTFFKSNVVLAADELILDTSNHYLGACGYTDTTTWTQETSLSVTTFQIWYYWTSGEGPVSFTLTKDGSEFATGVLTRTSCDPYQTSWCNGDLVMNKTFPAGSYSLKIANKKQCAIPSGNGAVRLYGAAQTTETSQSSESAQASESASTTTQSVDDTKTDSSLTMIYDNTENYLGGCGKTDSTSFTLTKDMGVVLMQIWYTWGSSEKNVSFTLTKDGSAFASGVFTKTTECQWTWCNGNYTINKTFSKGSTYTVTLGNANMCQDPKSRGSVRLFGVVKSSAETSGKTDTTSGKSSLKSNLPVIVLGVLGAGVIVAAAAYVLTKKSKKG